MDIDEIKKFVKDKKGGTPIENGVLGPFDFGSCHVWEVWVKDLLYDTRFVAGKKGETKREALRYFHSFQALCSFLNTEVNQHAVALKNLQIEQDRWLLEKENSQKKWEADNRRQNLQSMVAAFVFVITVMVMLYIAFVERQNYSVATIVTAIASLVASGSTFFFSKKRTAKPTNSEV